MKIEYKALIKAYIVYHNKSMVAVAQDRTQALRKAFNRIVFKKFNN